MDSSYIDESEKHVIEGSENGALLLKGSVRGT